MLRGKSLVSENILSVNEKLPPLKFRYFEKNIISLKNCSSGQHQIDLETFNSSTSPGTMVHVQHMQFVIFKFFENQKALFSQFAISCPLMPLTPEVKTPPNWFKFLHQLPE